jgi:hypothetical protein
MGGPECRMFQGCRTILVEMVMGAVEVVEVVEGQLAAGADVEVVVLLVAAEDVVEDAAEGAAEDVEVVVARTIFERASLEGLDSP